MVYDPAVEMAIDVFPCEDGHAQERALLGEVVPTVHLWIMDRNFCHGGIESRFLCRYHKGLPVTALAPAKFGDRAGKCMNSRSKSSSPRPGEDADDVSELTRAPAAATRPCSC